jgi:hypothetical protein
MLDKALKILSFFFIATAIYHLVGIFYHFNSSPVWRHALFACLSIPAFYGMYKRPPIFVYLFGALLVQQYYGHGRYLYKLWHEKQEIHWISVIDLTVLSIIFILLVIELIEKSRKIQVEL